MLQVGIRLHDVNTNGNPEEKTMQARAEKAKLEAKRARWYHNPEYSDETGPD